MVIIFAAVPSLDQMSFSLLHTAFFEAVEETEAILHPLHLPPQGQ